LIAVIKMKNTDDFSLNLFSDGMKDIEGLGYGDTSFDPKSVHSQLSWLNPRSLLIGLIQVYTGSTPTASTTKFSLRFRTNLTQVH
jgi:hypothetical protein